MMNGFLSLPYLGNRIGWRGVLFLASFLEGCVPRGGMTAKGGKEEELATGEITKSNERDHGDTPTRTTRDSVQ